MLTININEKLFTVLLSTSEYKYVHLKYLSR